MIFIRYAYGIAAVPFFLVGSGGLCPLFLASVIGGVGFAVRLAAMGANGFFGAGGSAAGVLRVAFLSRVIRHIAAFIGTFMPVMRCIGRPIGLPAVAGGVDWLRLCRAAYGTGIRLFALFCAGRRYCYRTVVPSMRAAYVILFIATGTLLPVLVIIMCPTGGEIMSQSIAIFRTANGACCLLGAGRRAAIVICLIEFYTAGAYLPVFCCVGFPVVALVVMVVALSLEHGQGHPGGFQIFAGGVPWLGVSRAVSLEQFQHAAVGKVKGRFFGGGGDGGSAIAVNLSGSAGQIVAVCDGNTIIARPTHNTAQHCICIGSCDTANVITVGNLYGMLGIISRVSCNAAGPLCGRRTALLIDSYSTSVVAIGYTSRISSSNNAADINRWGGTAVGGGTAVDKADYGAKVTAICNGGITCKPSDNAACIGSVIFGSDALYSAIIDTVTYLGARICNSNNATCRRLKRVMSIYRSGAHTARNAGVLRECYNTARVFSAVRVKVACHPYVLDSCPRYISEQSGSSPVAITI